MAIQIHIPTPMRQHTEGKAVVDATGHNVQAVLDDVGRQYPAFTQRIFENGRVRRFINIYLNEEDIRYLQDLNSATKDGDQLAIIPAVAGG